MLKITIEVLPHGKKANRKVLGNATIINDSTGDEEIGNYDATVLGASPVRVEGFKRSDGVWKLLYKVLQEVYKDGSIQECTEN